MIFFLITFVYSLDICRQLATYEQCIASKSEYCRWFHNQRYCRQSEDLMLGCDRNLSVKLCMRQISSPISTQVLCIFDTICHETIDLEKHECSQNLNKFGCLGITNKAQFCKWENSKCTSLSEDELSQLNTIFSDLSLSMSVCPLITGYLIAHSNVVQSYLGASFDYALLAQESDSTLSQTTYEDGELQNNFINLDGQFVWYIPQKQSQFTLAKLKLNDITRNGCIVLDISNDLMYNKLFSIENTRVLRGVNHVYCQYVNTNPYLIQLSVFINSECQIITSKEMQTRTDLTCAYQGKYACQMSNPSLNCQIVQPINVLEYQCMTNYHQIANINCDSNLGVASSIQCRQSTKQCFLDFDGQFGYCDSGCWSSITEVYCLAEVNCKWISEDIDENNFFRCSPFGGCEQEGLSHSYCVGLAMNCIWEDNQCKFGDLRIITCEQANTKYSCTNVQRQDQQCIWYKDTCINIITHSLFGHYYSLPQNLLRNRNQCVMQDKLLFRYNQFNKQCIQEKILDTKNLSNINRYFCFSLKLYTQWNYENQECILIEPLQFCDTRININPMICTKFQNCYYDERLFTCKNISNLANIRCDTKGQSYNKCISNQSELCAWRNGQCQYLTVVDKCYQLIDVTPLTCTLVQSSKCSYLQGSCVTNIANQIDCLSAMNQLQCQAQQSSCYFDQYQCRTADQAILNKLSCSGLSKSACLISIYQACQWNNNQCESYNTEFFTNCNEDVNSLACGQRKHNGKLSLTHFCEYNVNSMKCEQNVSPITDCGQNRIINIHRCMSFTQSTCYFRNNSCQQLSDNQNYKVSQLNSIKCTEANINVCTQITTLGEICIQQSNANFNLCINAPLYLWSKLTCTDIQSQVTGNLNRCILATDKCYYDSNTQQCKVQSDVSILYSCSDIISQSLCLIQTAGLCVFSNNRCQQISDSNVECKFRNKYACEYYGRNCIWDSVCKESLAYCPALYNQHYAMCQNSIGQCFSGQNGCNSEIFHNLPCDIGLSQQLCLKQQHLCQWIDSKCQPYPKDVIQCSQMKTVVQCLSIQHLQCVYFNNQCVEDTRIGGYGDYYDNESYEYCFNHPLSLYSYKQQCIQLFDASEQLDTTNSFNMQCSLVSTYIQCTQQRSVQCTFANSKCVQSTLTICQQEEGIFQSPQTCYQLSNCKWHSTKRGEGFCYQGTFSCSAITLKSLCLQDNGLMCKYTNNQCQDATFGSCQNIQGVLINYATCKALAPDCYYDFEVNLCKSVQRQIITCASATNLYECVYAYKSSCHVQYASNLYSSCTATTQSFNSDLNHYACTSLTDNFYLYDLLTYKCTQIASDKVLFECNHLNQKSCLQYTNQFECIWIDQSCQRYRRNPNLQCEQLNRPVCLSFSAQACVWSNQKCSIVSTVDCSTASCLYSQGYCMSINQVWNSQTNSCYGYSPLILINCDGFGYNRDQCLNSNILSCYWNEQKCTQYIYKMTVECINISQKECNKYQCVWDATIHQCVDNNQVNLSCDKYSKLSCLQFSNNNCIYDYNINQCISPANLSIYLQKCHQSLSFQLCKLVIHDTCTLYDELCLQWTPRLFGCDYIYNRFGCMYAPMPCQWLDDKCQQISTTTQLLCKDIPSSYNKVSCQQYSSDPCGFDDNLFQCTFKVNCVEELLDITSYTQPYLSKGCTEFSTALDCELSLFEACQWSNDQCIQSTMTACDNQNLKGCLQNHSSCVWRNKICYPVVINEISLPLATAISQSVCINLNTDKAIKYDVDTYSCVISEQTDGCDQAGLNNLGCFQVNKEPCQFTNKCVQFTSVSFNNCKEYMNVNAKVCSGLQNKKCKYDTINHKCIDSVVTDSCSTPGLSQLACLSITKNPCQWNGNSCSAFLPNGMIDQCDSSTIRNSLSCQLLNYQQSICIYDPLTFTCIPQFNRFTKCSTPGLNQYACYATLLEPCQFVNQQCVKFTVTTSPCYSILQVNQLACSAQANHSCAYQASSFSCTGVSLKVPCDSRGISHMACSLQSDCKWNSDTNMCVYKSITSESCTDLPEDSCLQISKCYFDSENSICRLKHCWDLSISECNGQQLNDETCYLDNQNNCQSAKICEDIIFLNATQDCKLFVINNAGCVQINNYCVSPNSYNRICPQTDCFNSLCKLDFGVCRAMQCSDHQYISCPNNNCAWIDNSCTLVNTCSDVHDPLVCPLTIVGNEQCSWQPSALKVGEYHCTSKPCYLFGSSWTFCQGNEMADQACFVTSYAQCESCEQQTDQATCISSTYCQFVNNKCKSILCQYFLTQEMCIANTRCYWSTVDSVCRKSCIKIVEQMYCDAIDYECHWNSATYQCQDGVLYNPDLSIVIPDSQVYSLLLSIIVVSLFVFN